MKILLIDSFGAWTHQSLGLNYLAEYASVNKDPDSNYEFKILSIPQREIKRKDFNQSPWFKRIIGFGADIIGFSCYVWNRIEFIDIIKQVFKDGLSPVIVLGGPEFNSITNTKGVLEENREISYVISGEGEYPFAELLKGLSSNSSIGNLNIPGLSYRENKELIIRNRYPGLSDINRIPSIISPSTDLDNYDFVMFETYRGCPYGCAFCTWSNTKFRKFDLERIYSELSILIHKGVKRIFIIDPVLGPDRMRMNSILDYITETCQDVGFNPGIFLFPDIFMIDEEYCEKLDNANCGFSFGVERKSKSRYVITDRIIRKRDLAASIQMINSRIPFYHVDLIYGLPGVTVESIKDTFDWLAKQGVPEIHCQPLSVLPGSQIESAAEDLNLEYQQNPPYIVLKTKELDQNEILDLQLFSWGVYNFYCKSTLTLHLLRLFLKVDPSKIIHDFIDWAGKNNHIPYKQIMESAPETIEESLELVNKYLHNLSYALSDRQLRDLYDTFKFDKLCCYAFKNDPLPQSKIRIEKPVYSGEKILNARIKFHDTNIHIAQLPESISGFVTEMYKYTLAKKRKSRHEGMDEYVIHPKGFFLVDEEMKLIIKELKHNDSVILNQIMFEKGCNDVHRTTIIKRIINLIQREILTLK